MLFKKQRNELFEIVTNNGLSPTALEELNSRETYAIAAKGIDFSFILTDITSSSSKKVYSRPYVDIRSADETFGADWQSVLKYFEEWVSILEEELNAPDLWLEAQANAKLFALDGAVPNEMFNASELRQLEGQVRQLVQGLTALALPAPAQKLLTDTVNEIPEKATRFTKKELEGWFMGAFIGQVTQLALSQEHVSAIAHLLKTTFMGLLQLH